MVKDMGKKKKGSKFLHDYDLDKKTRTTRLKASEEIFLKW